MRLTAPDGYTASRSYSIGSAPTDPTVIELTVERLEDGEVSTFLHDEVVVGDELEVRGPIGGWFVWDGEQPAVLVGGGSGVVPLMSMIRLARRTNRSHLLHAVVSVRTPDDLLYPDELPGGEATLVLLGRPATRVGTSRRPDPSRGRRPRRSSPTPTAFICGSPGFADAASALLVGLGVPVERIRVERFGPTGTPT